MTTSGLTPSPQHARLALPRLFRQRLHRIIRQVHILRCCRVVRAAGRAPGQGQAVSRGVSGPAPSPRGYRGASPWSVQRLTTHWSRPPTASATLPPLAAAHRWRSAFRPQIVPDTGALYNVLMRIIALKTLRLFWEQHPDAQQALQAWYRDAERAILEQVMF
jgi:hypothetical protein